MRLDMDCLEDYLSRAYSYHTRPYAHVAGYQSGVNRSPFYLSMQAYTQLASRIISPGVSDSPVFFIGSSDHDLYLPQAQSSRKLRPQHAADSLLPERDVKRGVLQVGELVHSLRDDLPRISVRHEVLPEVPHDDRLELQPAQAVLGCGVRGPEAGKMQIRGLAVSGSASVGSGCYRSTSPSIHSSDKHPCRLQIYTQSVIRPVA